MNEALSSLDAEFASLFTDFGRPSIAPKRLIRASLIQILVSVRSERQLMEQMQYNLLFRWIVGLGIDDPAWVPTVFTKNRNANMMTFLKNGRNKVPLDRVPSLAKALEVDPSYLMRLALDQAVGATAAKAITDIFGTPATENERGWLQELSDASDNSDPQHLRAMSSEDDAPSFRLPTAPEAGPWDHLTKNERT